MPATVSAPAVSATTAALRAETDIVHVQRVLQDGSRDAIAGGESREQVSTSTCGADGIILKERLVERSVELPEGTDLHTQTQQAEVAAPNYVTMEMLQQYQIFTLEGDRQVRNNMTRTLCLEAELRKKGDAALEAKNAELEAVIKASTNASKTKDAELEERLNALENERRRMAKPSWKRTGNGKRAGKQGFPGVELAHRDLYAFYEEECPDVLDTANAPGTDAATRSPSVIEQWCALSAN